MILNTIDLCSNIFSNLKFAGACNVFLVSKEAKDASLNIPSSRDSLLQLLGLLVLFVVILAACYFVTRWIASAGSGMVSASNIKVIETYKITTNKYIQIVKIAGEYMAIAISRDNITFLCKLDEENINTMPVKAMEFASFKDILAKVKNKKSDACDGVEDKVGEEDSEQYTDGEEEQ